MRPCDPNKPSIDPRRAAREEGAVAIERLLRGAGYVIKRKTLNDLWVALDLAMPLLAAGPAGTGKTSLVEALAEGCNVPLYEVTGHPGQEARDVIGAWNRRAQDRAEDAAIAAGLGLEEAWRRRWADEYFECGEVLDAYREAARAAEAGGPPPALLIDEGEKLPVPIQHTLLQPFARGFAAAPKLKGVIGVADPMLAPIVVMTTNDLKKLDEPLRDRCIGRSGYVAGAVALLVIGFSLISGLARRIGVVEPRIRIERSSDNNPSQAAREARYVTMQGAMVGETATTAERLREASALAAAGAWLAVTQRNATAEGLLRKLEAMGMLPARSVIAADKGNALATPYGALIFHYRAAPIGVEALSLGRDKAAGPALIVRLAADMPGGDALKVWASTRLDNVQLPRPFADESEVIAAGWQAEKLSAGQ